MSDRTVRFGNAPPKFLIVSALGDQIYIDGGDTLVSTIMDFRRREIEFVVYEMTEASVRRVVDPSVSE